MIVTITNTTNPAVTINALQTGEDGIATGGQRTNAIPYPFDWVGPLAGSATKVFAMHPADFRARAVIGGSPFDARGLWLQIVQAKIVSFAQAAQTGRRDVEELFMNAV